MFEMNMTMKLYLRALFIALVAFGGTSFILRDQQAAAPAAPAKLTITQQAAYPPFAWQLPWLHWERSGAV
jgi:hypothetical protein